MAYKVPFRNNLFMLGLERCEDIIVIDAWLRIRPRVQNSEGWKIHFEERFFGEGGWLLPSHLGNINSHLKRCSLPTIEFENSGSTAYAMLRGEQRVDDRQQIIKTLEENPDKRAEIVVKARAIAADLVRHAEPSGNLIPLNPVIPESLAQSIRTVEPTPEPVEKPVEPVLEVNDDLVQRGRVGSGYGSKILWTRNQLDIIADPSNTALDLAHRFGCTTATIYRVRKSLKQGHDIETSKPVKTLVKAPAVTPVKPPVDDKSMLRDLLRSAPGTLDTTALADRLTALQGDAKVKELEAEVERLKTALIAMTDERNAIIAENAQLRDLLGRFAA